MAKSAPAPVAKNVTNTVSAPLRLGTANAGATLREQALLAWQQTIGNRAVGLLLAGEQANAAAPADDATGPDERSAQPADDATASDNFNNSDNFDSSDKVGVSEQISEKIAKGVAKVGDQLNSSLVDPPNPANQSGAVPGLTTSGPATPIVQAPDAGNEASSATTTASTATAPASAPQSSSKTLAKTKTFAKTKSPAKTKTPAKAKTPANAKGPASDTQASTGTETASMTSSGSEPGTQVIETPSASPKVPATGPSLPTGATPAAPSSVPHEIAPRGFRHTKTSPPTHSKPAPLQRPIPRSAPRRSGRRKEKSQTPARPKLGDALLDNWRATAEGAVSSVPKGDLGEAKTAGAEVKKTADDIDSTRKGAQPEYEAEAKSKQKPMPEEPPKENYLNTAEADAALKAVKDAGDKKLTDQHFADIGQPPPYKGATLSPEDYKPAALKGLNDQLVQLTTALEGKDLPKAEREKMTKHLEAVKAEIQGIDSKASQKDPPQAPPVIQDAGAAKLEPPSKEAAAVLGEGLKRAMGKVGAKSKSIVDGAVRLAKGSAVEAMVKLGEKELPGVQKEIDLELDGIAKASGLVAANLRKAIETEKGAVTQDAAANKEHIDEAAQQGKAKVEERGKDEQRKISGAAAAVDQEATAKKQAASGPPDSEAIEKKRDEYVGNVSTTGAQAKAALKACLTRREAALDEAARTQKASIKQIADKQSAAIKRHWENDKSNTDPNKGIVEARPTTEWASTRSAAVDAELKRLKAAAATQTEGYVAGVDTQMDASREKIRDWAARQEGRERSWWDRLWDMITDWFSDVKTTNTAWEEQRNAESRDAMMGDLTALSKLRELHNEGNKQARDAELARLDKDQRALAIQYLTGGIDSVEYVAESTMGRIAKRRAPELAKKFEETAIAEWGWEDLNQLAQQSNRGFNASALAAKVRGGVEGWGTDEGKVFAGLGGARTAVERAALKKAYKEIYGDSIESDVRGDLSGHEKERANALMEGKSAEADAAAIKEAVAGWGTDEKAIKDALRGKTPEELEAIKAEYKRMYGVELKTDLADDMEGAELDTATALLDGDLDKADAAELEDAMAGLGTDEDTLKRVYERIREEEEAKARAQGLTPSELAQRIKDRNQRVTKAYNEKYGKEVDLETRMVAEMADVDESAVANLKARGSKIVDTADVKLMSALQEGDTSKIDAAKALQEHESTYTSDDEIEKIARNQHKKATLEYDLELGVKQSQLQAKYESGDITRAEYEAGMKTVGEQRKGEARDAAVKAKAQKNMGSLKEAYSKYTGGTQSFDQLVEQETSGNSQDEITELVTEGGKLSDDREIYFAVKGAGTDEDMIKDTLKGKTPADIQKIREKYEAVHGEGSFDADILGDLSGREDLDVGHTLKYGDPSTYADQLAAEKDPAKRKALLEGFKTMLKEREKYENGSASVEAKEGMQTAKQIAKSIERAEQYDKALTEYQQLSGTKDADPAKLRELELSMLAAQSKFDANFQGTIEAQQQMRDRIDAQAELAAQIGGAIAGIVVTVATFGAAGPVVAGVYGALAAGAMTMAIKAHVLGLNVYSWEAAGQDLAMTGIDVALSAATAGTSKAFALAKAAKGAGVAGAAGLKEAMVKQAVSKGVTKEVAEKEAELALKKIVTDYSDRIVVQIGEQTVQGGGNAFGGALIDDNTWKSGDPWGAIKTQTLTGAGVGVGMGLGMKGALAGVGHLKGKAGAPDVEVPHGHLGGEGEVKAKGGAELEPHGGTEVKPAEADSPGTSSAGGGLASEADPSKFVDDALSAKGPGELDAPGAKLGEQTPGIKGGDETPTVKPNETPMGRPSVDDVGKALSDDDLAKRYGMPKKNVDKIKGICAEEGVIIDIRPTTPHAEPMLREGTALPKPEKLKAKTINEEDVLLGLARPEDLGKVGFFDPHNARLPDNFDELPPAQQKKLLAREAQRAEEWDAYGRDMAKLLDDGKIELLPDGTIVNKGLIKGGDELPFTGDHDIFDIRNKDGSPLSPERYAEVKKKLLEADAGIMHGGVTGWEHDSPSTFFTEAGQKSYKKMVGDHSPGGKEPLVRFGDGEPKGTWYEPAKAPDISAPDAKAPGVEGPHAKPDAVVADPKTAAAHEAHARTLEAALPDDLKGKVPVAVHSGLEGNTVQVHCGIDPETGLVKNIRINAGPEATATDIALHIKTVKSMQKYQGLMGEVRLFLQEIKAFLGFERIVPGTPAWKAMLEVEKLPAIIEERLDRLARTTDATERAMLTAEVEHLRNQFEMHSRDIKVSAGEPEAMYVAAQGLSAQKKKRYAALEAELRGKIPGTPSHRQIRWDMYQLVGGDMEYGAWKNVYDSNIGKATRANEKVSEVHKQLGWGETEQTVKTGRDEYRRLDIADVDAKKGIEVKAYESEYITDSPDISSEIERDAKLVKNKGWTITWLMLDTKPSLPLLEKLIDAGISVEIRLTNVSLDAATVKELRAAGAVVKK